MSLIGNILGAMGVLPPGAFQNSTASSKVSAGSPLGDAFGMAGPANLPAITEKSAMSISAVWACVSLIGGAISTLPLYIYDQKKNGERRRREDDPLDLMFNNEFCGRWAAHAGWSYLALSKLFHGDAFAEIKRQGAKVTGLVPIHPNRIEIAVWNDGSRLVYVVHPERFLPDQKVRIIDQDDMLHVTGLGFDGCRSLSPLQNALKMSGAVALATQDHSAQFFANQARPDYALVAPPAAKFSEAQVESLRAAIEQKHGFASGNSNRPMLLTGGLKVESISLTNDDAQLLATREYQTEEIARVYGVPPFMIGHNKGTSDWGSGVAERGIGFVRYVLRPHLNAFKNEINRKIIRQPDRVADFDTFELERADLKTLFETFRAAVGRAGEQPLMTVEEVRRLINLPAKPEFGAFPKDSTDAQ
jgi:HK97 family phage portal protein